MTALGAWLKQLILLVLLAVVTDLLLPAHALQKYVRTVMGLAIIAAILQPLVPFFEPGWTQRLAQTAAVELFGEPATSASAPALPGFTAHLRKQAEQDADLYAAQSLASELAAQTGIHGVQVKVAGASHGASALHVTVWLPASAAGRAEAVRQWVAQALHTAPSQVEVRVGGGEGNGL